MMFSVSAYINCSQVLENCSVSRLLICLEKKHAAFQCTVSNVFKAVLSNWRLIRVHWLYVWVLLHVCMCELVEREEDKEEECR